MDPLARPCDLMRLLTRTTAVIRLYDTGAILEVGLEEPLDPTRACLSTPVGPTPAEVVLGPFAGERHEACRLTVQFATPAVHPPPMRFTRRQKERVNGPGAGKRPREEDCA